MRRSLAQQAALLQRRLSFSSAALAQEAADQAAPRLRGAAAGEALRRAREAVDPFLLSAELRDEAGSLPSARLRKQGRTPAVVFNQFDKEKLLITLDDRELMRKARRTAARSAELHSLTRSLAHAADHVP